MYLALGILLLLVGEIVIVRSEVGGVYWYWAWFLVRPQESWPGLGGPAPMERIFALTLIACTVYRYRLADRRVLVPSTPMKAFAGLVLVNFLSVLTSVWQGNSLDYSIKFLKFFIFIWIAAIVLNTPKRFLGFLWVYVLAIGWEAFSTIQNYYTNPYFAQGIQRAEGLSESWGDPNATALNLALALPIVLAVLITSEEWKPRILLLGIAILAGVALILTGSRSGFLNLIVAFIAMGVRAKKKAILLPGIIVLGCIIWVLTPEQYKQRYETLLGFAEDPTAQLDTSQGESAYGRIIGFRVAMMMFADHPILGVGAGNFPYSWRFGPYSYQGYKGWHQPHNLPGQVLSEQGLVGAVSFIVFIVVILRSTGIGVRKILSRRKPPLVLLAVGKMIPVIMIGLILGGFSGHSYYRYNWYLICLCSAVILQVSEQTANKTKIQTDLQAPSLLEMARRTTKSTRQRVKDKRQRKKIPERT
jgi:O-antigen ligase